MLKNNVENIAPFISCISKINNTLIDYEYFLKHYKLIAIDSSKQFDLENFNLKQQIKFIGRLERNEGAAMFFIIEKSEETTIEFSQNAVSVV